MKTCSICKQPKSLEDFNRNAKRKDGVQTYCRDCQREYDKRHYQKSESRQQDRQARSAARRKEIQLEVNKYKREQGCERCQESDECCLDFHHKDGGKEYDVSRMVSLGVSIKKIWEEISKCIVLCANCHRKLHADRWRIGEKS